MTDLAELGIIVSSDAIKASSELDRLTTSAISAEKAVDTLKSTSSSLQRAFQRANSNLGSSGFDKVSRDLDKLGNSLDKAINKLRKEDAKKQAVELKELAKAIAEIERAEKAAAKSQETELKELERALQRLAKEEEKATAAAKKQADAREKVVIAGLRRELAELAKLEQARQKEAADAARMDFDRFMGVNQPVSRSAADSASVFQDVFRQQELAAKEAERQFKESEKNKALAAKQAAADIISAEKQQAQAAREAAREQDILTGRVNNLLSAIDPVGSKLRELEGQLREATQLYKMGAITTEQYAMAQQDLTRKISLTTEAQRQANLTRQQGNATTRQSIQQAQNLSYQLNDIFVSLASGQNPLTVFIQQGSQIATIWGPGKGVGGILKELISSMRTLLAPLRLIAGVAAVATLSIAAMTKQIRDSTKVAVTFGDVFKATFQVIGKRISDFFSGDKETNNLMKRVFDHLVEDAKLGGETLIGIFGFIGDTLVTVWEQLPTILGDIFISLFNNVVTTLQKIINYFIDGVNTVTSIADKIIGKNTAPLEKVTFANDLPKTRDGIKNLFGGIADAAAKNFSDEFYNKLDKEISSQAVKNHNKPTKEQLKAAERLKENIQAQQLDLEQTTRLVDARRKSVEAYNAMVDAIAAENKALSLGLKPGTETYKQVVARQLAIEKLKNEVKALDDEDKKHLETQKEYAAIVKEFNLGLEVNAGLVASQRLEQFKLTDTYKQGTPAFKEHIDQLIVGIKNYKETVDAATQAKEALSEFAQQQNKLLDAQAGIFSKVAEGATNTLEDGIANGIKNGFGKGESFVKQFENTLRDSIIHGFASGVAAIAAMKVVNPLITDFAGLVSPELKKAVGDKLGVKDTGTASLFSALRSSTAFSTAGGFGSINQFGNRYLGTGIGGDAGRNGSSTSLSGYLAGAGTGAGIGSANFFGGNQTGSTIGGTIGGAAGAYFGPLGSLYYGTVGSGIGGLFGPGSPVSASEFAGSIGANDNLSSLSYGAKNGQVSQAKGLAEMLGDSLAQLVTQGIDFANVDIRGAFNSKSGNRFEALGQTFGFDPQDASSVSDAMAKLAVELARAGNNTGSLGIALKNIQTDGRKAEDILADLNFAAAFDKLGEVPKTLTSMEQAVSDLNTQFDAAAKTTARLGLSEAKLEQYRQDRLSALRNDFNSDIKKQILSIKDPISSALAQLDADFDTVRRDAVAVGGDLVAVEELYGLKRTAILQQQLEEQNQLINSKLDDQVNIQLDAFDATAKGLESTRDTFRNFATSLRLFKDNLLTDTTLSPLSNEERFRAAQGQFNSILAQARLGNKDAIAQVEDVSKTYLQAANDYFGSTAPVFDSVQKALSDVADLSDRQANIATQQLDALNTQIDLLSQIETAIKSAGSNTVGNTNGSGQPLLNATKYGSDPVVSKINYLLDAATGFKFQGNFGGGAFNKFAASSALTDAEREAARQVHRAFGYTPAYANGGTPDITKPFIAGDINGAGGEIIMPQSNPVRVINNKDSKSLISSINNNEDVVAAIRELTAEVRTLRRQVADSDKNNKDAVAGLEDTISVFNNKLVSIINKPRIA